jgi:hypothetical protein
MIKNYTKNCISEKLNSQLSFDFNHASSSIPNDVPSEMCIQKILGFANALEIKKSEMLNQMMILKN